MKNAVFWDIKPYSYFTGNTLGLCYRAQQVNATQELRFFTAIPMKNAVFWDIKPSSYLTEETSQLRYRAQPVNAI
jgi:nitrate reductase gamma subunit